VTTGLGLMAVTHIRNQDVYGGARRDRDGSGTHASLDADLLVIWGCRNLDGAGRLVPVGLDGFRGGQAITRLPGRLSLRVRLVAAALCLVAAGAGIVGAATGLMARGYFMRHADQQLRGYADRLTSRPLRATPGSGLAPGAASPGGFAGAAFSIEVRGAGGQLVMAAGDRPQVRRADARHYR
jgi:hypothetical protein